MNKYTKVIFYNIKNMKKIISAILMLIVSLAAGMPLMAQSFFVEADGVGPVKKGADYRKLPKAVPGLYDKYTVVEEYNSMEDYNEIQCTFSLNGKDRIYAAANEEGDIWMVTIATSDLRTKSGAYNSMPAREFIKLPGIKVVLRPEADYNQVSFEIDGVPVGIDEYSYTAAGKQKIKKSLRSKVAPKFVATDFTSNSTIALGGFNY